MGEVSQQCGDVGEPVQSRDGDGARKKTNKQTNTLRRLLVVPPAPPLPRRRSCSWVWFGCVQAHHMFCVCDLFVFWLRRQFPGARRHRGHDAGGVVQPGRGGQGGWSVAVEREANSRAKVNSACKRVELRVFSGRGCSVSAHG